VYFQLLGNLTVRRNGARIDLGGLRQQRLLVALLLDVDKVVSADRLIDTMWDGEPPATARRQLHNAVAAIRRSFTSAKDIIVKDGPGYRVQVDPQAVDVHRFTATIARASGEVAEGRLERAVELLESGLAIWEGPALSGLRNSTLDIAAATLEEKRLSAIEQLFALRLAGGDAAALVPQLGELVSQHPLREETRRLLILALHHSGRRADALNVYERGRRLLRDEMGVDPGVGLRQVYERILRDDLPQPGQSPKPAAGDRPAAVPVPDSGATRSFLPYDTAHFTGRADELRSFTTTSCPTTETALGIVAIDGMPGVGKTTLAVRLAHQLAYRYPEGHLFIDLHGNTHGQSPLDPDAALERLLLDFGLPAAQIPQDSRQRVARWRAEVADRRILVVLDNALDARQIRPLLPGTGKALVIITSRQRLAGVDGVRSRSLDVFSPEDAAELFTKIVGAGRIGGRQDRVASVVALCGYLPLAISIVASRFHNRPAWSLDHLIVRLSGERQRLAELSLGDRSVSALFDVSYQNLSPAQRRLYRMLGRAVRFGEDFDAGTAATVANVSVAEADRLLEELFDVHVLRQWTAGRYYFHELLHEHARTGAAEELVISGGTLNLFGRSAGASARGA
jgi:DNA-binding SARP family transcriptional activator